MTSSQDEYRISQEANAWLREKWEHEQKARDTLDKLKSAVSIACKQKSGYVKTKEGSKIVFA